MRYVKTAVLATAAVILSVALAQPSRAEVSFELAYSNLSEHGAWLVSAQYGHVWQPTEYNRDWNPYYDGHWIYTDMGWTWVSDYEWGSIPYHYGTWVSDPDSGWVWIPGRVWAPAWVVFRTGPDYIGWAPVPPGFSVGMNIDMGAASTFVYVASHDFLAPRVRLSIVPRERAIVFMNSTTVVNNIVVQNNIVINRGPDYRTVERATGRTIREERIESVARVAPFAHVDRAELAVDPATAKRGVRVAEPVPASQPLPVSKSGPGHQRNSVPTDASNRTNGGPAAQPNSAPAAAPLPMPPMSEPADASQKRHGAQSPPGQEKANAQQSAQAEADAKANAQQSAQEQVNAKTHADQSAQAAASAKAKSDQSAQSQADAKAHAEQSAQAAASAKAKADQSAQSQANARAHSDQHAQSQANAKAKADQNAQSQAIAKAHADQNAQALASDKAKADQNAKSQAAAKAHTDQNAQAQANAKAKADQSAQAQAADKAHADQTAQAQANAKAAAEAKAKKHNPPKPPPPKDDTSGKDSTPSTKDQTPPR